MASTRTAPLLTRGERLRLARERAGMSVGEMARRMHKHRNNIPRWESRHGSPSLEVMDAYADILGNVSVEWWRAGAT